MLGMGKGFVIILFIALGIWYGTKNVTLAFQIVVAYAVVRIVWRFLTGGQKKV